MNDHTPISTSSHISIFNIFTLLFSFCLFPSQVFADDKQLTYDATLSSFNYPFPVKEYALASQRQKLTMRYMDIGAEDVSDAQPDKTQKKATQQKVAVLLHGKNFSGYYWKEVAELLVEQNYRVIIPDQIGFGKSSKPAHYQYSFAQLALNTQSLLNHIGIEKYKVVGHSMGGMLATTLALNDPKVSDLILINPIGLEPYLDYVEIKDPEFFYQSEKNKTAEKVRDYQKANYYDGQWKEEYERLIAPHIGWLNGPDKDLIAWNNALTYMPIFAEDITSKFSKITVPTQLIIGTRDRTGPGRNWKKEGVKHTLGQYQELGKQTAKKIPNAKLYELDGLGHMPQIENFEKFKPVFLDAMNI